MSIKELGNQPYTVKQPNLKRTVNPVYEKYRIHTENPDYEELILKFSKELGFERDHADPQFLFRHPKDPLLQIFYAGGDTKIFYISRLDKEAVIDVVFCEDAVDKDRSMLRVVDFVNEMLEATRDMYKD